jgi:hypothetical protein
MVKALARAFRWRKMLDEGEHATLEDLAKSKEIGKTYVSRVLRLTLLAPDFVEAILDGRQPAAQLDDLLEGFPLESAGQISILYLFRNALSCTKAACFHLGARVRPGNEPVRLQYSR